MKTKTILLLATLCLLFLGRATHAQLTSFTYQGLLATNGVPLTGNFSMTANVYDAATNGNFILGALLPSVDVVNGLFSTEVRINSSVFNGEARWLEMRIQHPFGVATNIVLMPRQKITAVPYATLAMNVASNSVSSNSIQGGSIVGAKIANGQVVRSINGLADSVVIVGGNNISLTTNGNNLQIAATATGNGISIPYSASLSLNGSNVGRALLVLSNTAPSGFSDGIQGNTASSDGAGIFGWATAQTGVNKGVLGRTSSTNGFGVIGENVPKGTGALLGTAFEGAYAYANQTNQSGVHGYSVMFDGVHGTSGSRYAAGIAGINIDGGIGVYGRSTAGGVAALLDGPVTVRGDTRINDFNIWLRGGTDIQHGLGWHGAGKLWAGQAFEGPVLFGWAGGALGTSQFGQRAALSWDSGDNVKVTRNFSACSITVRGGCDLAEPFDMPKEISKGSVVVIDEANPGHLKLSTEPYDKRVAGIVSGANGVNTGISLTQEGVLESGQNVALTGRVYVLADASSGAIMPGDLLTSASMPGHAMKVTDPTRAHGAVLGKAMTTLKSGRGMVLVLVSLQ